ncbi:hypothetical protein [Thalassobacillus sp. CUG 92003]|uniref:hypothetical protein n=1 Tax=Thalassobacillus sp. CUG 92003 TaxID=2736641 RepID=UPI0015E6CB12|nr:hypothetical protein [Thalassobacillus sp. CUG 92003]
MGIFIGVLGIIIALGVAGLAFQRNQHVDDAPITVDYDQYRREASSTAKRNQTAMLLRVFGVVGIVIFVLLGVAMMRDAIVYAGLMVIFFGIVVCFLLVGLSEIILILDKRLQPNSEELSDEGKHNH